MAQRIEDEQIVLALSQKQWFALNALLYGLRDGDSALVDLTRDRANDVYLDSAQRAELVNLWADIHDVPNDH